ncbi:MAG: crossover junction endodeoxyribonuclease RuvC [Candidatus Kryptoniota bacterium]
MIVLGIDPGSRKTGYAIVESVGHRKQLLAFGTINLVDTQAMPEKLVKIYEQITKIFKEFHIDSVAVEAGFYGKNAQSAYKLGYARSAAVLSAALHGVNVIEYSPRKIKQSVTGNGNASKEQVKYMVKALLKNDDINIKDDESDACAAALCHLNNDFNREKTTRSWSVFVSKNPTRVFKRK